MNTLDHILLGMLRTAASGYDLKQEFEMSIRHFWAAELSQIYPTLKKLERKRLLRSFAAPPTKGPPRRLYQTTSLGHAALRQWLSQAPIIADERFPYIAQIYFMDELDDARKTAQFIQCYRSRVEGLRQKMAGFERLWRKQDARYPDELPPHDFHVFLTRRLAVVIAEAKLHWCDETLRRLSKRTHSKKMRSSRARSQSGGGEQ